MTQVNLREAKAQLSKLLDRAAKGEDVVIAKNGKLVAVLVAPEKVKKRRREFGFLKADMAALSKRRGKVGKRLGVAEGRFVAPEPDAELDAEIAKLFTGE